MNTKILTTHVGSLPRSKALSELLFAKDKGDSFSENEFDDVVKQNVSDVVKKQLDIGIDFRFILAPNLPSSIFDKSPKKPSEISIAEFIYLCALDPNIHGLGYKY